MQEFLTKLLRKGFSILLNTGLTIIGLVVIVVSVGLLLMGDLTIASITFAVGLALAAYGTRWFWYPPLKKKREEEEELANIPYLSASKHIDEDDEANEFAEETYLKAYNDFNAINDLIPQLADKELKHQLLKMQNIAMKLINYLHDNPAKMSLADQFINYYQDRALSLSQQFLEFEEMGLNTPEIADVKAKTKRTLDSFDEAYEAQFTRLLTDKVMEMESELKVAEQIMSDAGIENKDKTTYKQSQPASDKSQLPDADHSTNPFSVERPFETEAEPSHAGKKPRGRFQH